MGGILGMNSHSVSFFACSEGPSCSIFLFVHAPLMETEALALAVLQGTHYLTLRRCLAAGRRMKSLGARARLAESASPFCHFLAV